jgi:hypothetical protein
MNDADVGRAGRDAIPTRAGPDRTAGLLVEGYPFLAERRRRWGSGPHADGHAVELRLLGERAVCVGGPEAAGLFYDPVRFRRATPFLGRWPSPCSARTRSTCTTDARRRVWDLERIVDGFVGIGRAMRRPGWPASAPNDGWPGCSGTCGPRVTRRRRARPWRSSRGTGSWTASCWMSRRRPSSC